VTITAEPTLSAKKHVILLVSPQHRDSLSDQIEDMGWAVVAARRFEGMERRLAEIGASVVILDFRGTAAGEIGDLGALLAAGGSHNPALVAITERGDSLAIDAAIAAGAVQVIQAPFSSDDVHIALRLASRHVSGVGGGGGAEQTLPQMSAHRDVLTGLHDQRAVRDWIGQRLQPDSAHRVSVLLISITRFDTINSAFGVDSGDRVLRSIAHRIEPLVADLGKDTLVARSTGAEFIVCIGDAIPPTRLMLLAESIVELIERPISTGSDIIKLGCRVGIAPAHREDREAIQILKRADLALAKAKALESGRIQIVSDGQSDISAASALQADLRVALMRGEIEVLFQPQVSVASGDIVGVEALARWQHPVHGELGAATLFAAAEKSDYMLELSAHVQREAAFQAARWPAALSKLRLSINVTAQDIAKPSFVPAFLAMIAESNFPRDRLTVEITETGLMEDLAVASDILAALRAQGCRVAIDDFGTGYSSLAYLKALPLDYLKIDRGLSVDIAGSARDSVVVRGVIDMARSLGLSVIAEGVETEEQLGLLAREGCNLYQGFLCARPMTTEKLIALMAG
jgi:diguanylate cyclase (GGDEF)-like protein